MTNAAGTGGDFGNMEAEIGDLAPTALTGRLNDLGSRVSSPFTASVVLPAMITGAGEHASRRFIEFFTAQIRNKGTRAAYLHAVTKFFDWCEANGVVFEQVQPIVVATYVESLGARL